jgi:phosphoribosylformylglycinamidine synthase
MAESCSVLGTPVTGGNVSFYNETEGRGVYPTPVIGMVGVVEDLKHITTQWFRNENRAILLLGVTGNDLGASEYSLAIWNRIEGSVPRLDLERERRVQEACLSIIQSGLAESAHDVSDGGLAIALAECAFSSYRKDAIGFRVNLEGDLESAVLLFAESPSRIVISAADSEVDQVLRIADQCGVEAAVIGRTGGDRIVIDVNGRRVIDSRVSEIEQLWREVLPAALEVASLVAAEEK